VNNDGQPAALFIPHMPPARVQAGAAAVALHPGRSGCGGRGANAEERSRTHPALVVVAVAGL